jgi:chromosome segregation ATPase
LLELRKAVQDARVDADEQRAHADGLGVQAEALVRRNLELQNQARASGEEADAHRRRVTELEAAVRRAELQSEGAESRLADMERRLQQATEEAMQARALLGSTAESAREVKDRADHEADRLRAELANAQQRLREVEQQHSAASESARRLSTQTETMQRELHAVREQAQRVSEADLAAALAACKKAQEAAAAAEGRERDAMSALAEAKRQADTFAERLQASQATIGGQAQQWKQQIEDLQTQNRALSDRVASMDERDRTLTRAMQHAQAAAERTQGLGRTIGDIMKQSAEFADRLLDLQGRVETLVARVDRAGSVLERDTAEVRTVRDATTKALSQLQRLHERGSASEVELKSMSGQLQQTVSAAREREQSSLREVQRLQDQLDEVRNELRLARAELDAERGVKAQTNSAMKELVTKIKSSQAAVPLPPGRRASRTFDASALSSALGEVRKSAGQL